MNLAVLRAFRHPLILASIALMAINDQVLKSAAPSWLTGKLSDFAGLFFFPFLLGALLQLGMRLVLRCGFRPTIFLHWLNKMAAKIPVTRVIGFLMTGLIFTGVKTMPGINAAVTALFPYPAQIILDPTDLLALVALWPAWRLWSRIEHQAPEASSQQPAGKWAYLALGAASLASLATAPCPPAIAVVRLTKLEGRLYAAVSPNYDVHGYTQVPVAAYSSIDQGRSWSVEPVIPENASKALNKPVTLPLAACDPQQPLVCYNISNTSLIEVSRDGGRSWGVSWQIPPGRETYMDRAAGRGSFLTCWKAPDRHPFDIDFLPGSSGSVVIIAMGNEGVLRREPSGTWERVSVDASRGPKVGPTPFYADNLSSALAATGPEFGLLLLLSILTYLGISLWAWVAAARNHAPGKRAVGAFWPLLIPLGGIGLYLFLLAGSFLLPQNIRSTISLIEFIVLALLPLALLLASTVLWLTTGSLAARPSRFRALIWAAGGTGFGLLLIAWLPFILWAFGISPYYNFALALACVLGLVLLIFSVMRIRPRLHQSLVPLPIETASGATEP